MHDPTILRTNPTAIFPGIRVGGIRFRTRFAGAGLVAVACVLTCSMTASAQQAAGIAGVVRDTSGAVVPGVSVEAASPALIEKVRTAVTDAKAATTSSTCGLAPTASRSR